ncbi:TIR domain-containing protein [Xanthomonas arboricola]|uniref:TIR domain-containing protein n=1 Tax=Xanthomonas arboricola TaxID=56448 RepID=UPI0009BC2CD1
MSQRRHLFISHRFVDDASVGHLTKMLNRAGWDIRNSSVRLRQANEQRRQNGEIPERALERLLRMKVSWAQTVVVVIGRTTHRSKWVDYEIEQANRLGKRIVGIYARGEREAKLPESLEKYASSIVAWSTQSIREAIDNGENKFETPDGASREPTNNSARQNC